MESYFEGFSFTTGVVRYRDLGYLVATADHLAAERVPHTRIFTLDRGELGAEDLDWMVTSASVCHAPEERFIAIAEAGYVQVFGGGQIAEEPAVEARDSAPQDRGPLREVRGIAGGRAYAVGTSRQAYRRDGPGAWTCIDQTARPSAEDAADTSFESIDGFSESDIYAVGWEGEIWHYDGERWHPIDSPTNLALYRVRCAADGYVYACGQVGTLLRGRGDAWEILAEGQAEADFWGLEWFEGTLYVASLHLLYELEGDALRRVDFGEAVPPATCYQLSAADGILWSIGAKDVMKFDGEAWTDVARIQG